MLKSYTLTRDRPILQRTSITYYVARNEDGTCVLLARCLDDSLHDKLDALETRRQEFMHSIGTDPGHYCDYKNCDSTQRSCLWLIPKPLILSEGRQGKYFFYSICYRCLCLEEAILLKDLSISFCCSSATACRLLVGLLLLVDRIIRMRIAVSLSLDNLLFDPVKALVTLIDWRGTKFLEYIPLPLSIIYYRRVARIIFQVVSAKQLSQDLPELFRYLRSMANWHHEWPSGTEAALKYARVVAERQTGILEDVNAILAGEGFQSKQPLYEFNRRGK